MKRFLVALSIAACIGCSDRRHDDATKAEIRVYAPVTAAAAAIAVVEKPDAARALLLGDEAMALGPYLARAGAKPMTAADGRFDLLVIACDEMTEASCRKAQFLLAEDGVAIWLMNVANVTMAKFQAKLKSFAMESVHLWMPGEHNWILTGRKRPRKIKLSAMLEVFTRETAFSDFADGGCGSLAELFANYVGLREDVLPAFGVNDPTASVRPEFFLTKEIPAVEWISPEGVDTDVAKAVQTGMRSMQVVRRLAIEGSLLAQVAKDKDGEEAAIVKWNRAILRNPGELFVRERLDRLDTAAREFLKHGKLLQAMKCFETMMRIRPTAASVHNFGMCLKKLGKADLAEKVLKRAKELEK